MNEKLMHRLLQTFAILLITLWLLRFIFIAYADITIQWVFILLFSISVVGYVLTYYHRYRWAARLLVSVLVISPFASLFLDNFLDVPAFIFVMSIFSVMSAYFFLSVQGLMVVISTNLLLTAFTVISMDFPQQSVGMAIFIVTVSSLLILVATIIRDQREAVLNLQTAELLSSEGRLRALFEAAFETIIVHDDAYLIDINRAGEELFGYKRSELNNLHLSDLLTKTLSIPSIEAVNKEELVPFESVGLTRNGEVFPVEVLTRAYDYRGQMVSVSAVRDITYRKKMDARLHRRIATEQMIAKMSRLFAEISPEKLDNAFESSLGLVGMLADVDRSFIFIMQGEGAKLRQVYEWCAEGIARGYDAVKNTTASDWGWWMNHLRYSDRIAITTLSELSDEGGKEREILDSAGVKSVVAVPMRYRQDLVGFIGMDSTRIERIWSNDDISLLQLVAEMFVNAFERNLTTVALQQSERRFSLVFKNSPVPIAIITRRGGEFLDVNASFMELIGYTHDEIAGQTANDLDLWFNADEQEHFLHQLKGKSRLHNVESVIKRQDDSVRNVLVSVENISVEDENAVLILALDITERKHAEEQKRQLALERERGDVLNRFISDTSHDFKTPLSVMRMETYLARRKTELVDDEAPWLSHLDVLDLQVSRLENIINDLLRMIRLDRGDKFHFQPTKINQIVEMVVNRRETMITENGQSLHFDPDPTLTEVTLDAQEFSEAIDRLLKNASSFSDTGDKITVRTYQDDDYALVEIEDEGEGIAEDILPNIFNRLYRGNSARTTDGSGSGLGLPIAQQIIRVHHGEIDVESTYGKGSIFRVRIPIIQSTGTQEFEAFGTIDKDNSYNTP